MISLGASNVFLSTPGKVRCPILATSCEQLSVTILWIRNAKFNGKNCHKMSLPLGHLTCDKLSTSACT